MSTLKAKTQSSMPGIAAVPAQLASKARRQKGGCKPKVEGGSREARRRAAVILDVLAGVSTPLEAAEALSVSPTRYYMLETKLVSALVAACEPGQGDKRRKPEEKRLAELEAELARTKRECARKQNLVRVMERTMGLAFADPKKTPAAKPAGKRRRARKPQVRALRVSELLRSELPADSSESGSTQVSTPAGQGA